MAERARLVRIAGVLAGVVASNSGVVPPTTGSFLPLLALVLDLFLDSFKICNLKAKRLSIPIPSPYFPIPLHFET